MVSNLLNNVSLIIKNHKKLAEVKGEDFNVFSILKMERKENDTHSAFLRALLNPKGKHHLKALFLELFLQVLKENNPSFLETNTSLQNFNPNGASVDLEVSVGTKKTCKNPGNCKNQISCECSGGRVDIYLKDALGNIISIENKIDAIDQDAQLKRYYNHNTATNTVIYLNKNGNAPSKNSSRGLINGEHFLTISYSQHIIQWLELCLKETANQPILRETIKQYIFLIKKITNTVTNEEREDLKAEMFKESNIKASRLVAKNYQDIEGSIKEDFRKAVYEKLKNTSALSDFEIHLDKKKPATKPCSSIWIRFKAYKDSDQFYGIESFSGEGNTNGNLYVGILNRYPEHNIFNTEKFAKICQDSITNIDSDWWPLAYNIMYKNKPLNTLNSSVLSIISNKKNRGYEEILDLVVAQTLKFIEDTKDDLLLYLKEKNQDDKSI